MPRIIEAKVGKVVGPLRMKVVPTSSGDTKAQTPKSKVRDHALAIASSNLETRRGRFTRGVNGTKKNRSKSLPSSKEASLLFGQPPEIDEQEYPVEPKKSNIYRSQELLVATPTVSAPSKDCTDSFKSKDFTTIVDEHYPSITSAGPSLERYALALDTRFLSTSATIRSGNESSSVVEKMIHNCKVLTKSLHARGITPCIIASTTSDMTRSHLHSSPENKRVAAALTDLGIGIETHKILHDCTDIFRKAMDIEDSTLYSQVDIPSSSSNTGAFSIPLPLNATYSWLLFSAMVDSIIAEDMTFIGFISSKTLNANKGAINVSIICSDVSLFCDTNDDSHRAGLQVFIDHVTPYFQQGLLSSIAITVATKSGQLALSTEENDENVIPLEASGRPLNVATPEQQENHQTAMQNCIRLIDWTLHDFINGIHQSRNDLTGSSLRCSFMLVKNSIIDFMVLSHSLVRTILTGCNARLDCRLRRIDLPVSGDGTHCSISLEASYELFPFTVHSLYSKFLSSDLDDLSTMNLKVVQIIPLAMIDASLLFGFPLVVRAGLEQDYAQFEEMKILVRSLFSVLQTREQAILLRGSSHRKSNKRATDSGFSSPSEQYFILMSQEIPSTLIYTENASRPSSGLLCRIAHCDHLLHDNYMTDSVFGQCIQTDDDRETEIQYTEYIENSLSTLSIGMYNPFTISKLKDERLNAPKLYKHVCDEDEHDSATFLLEGAEALQPTKSPISLLGDASSSNSLSEMNVSYEETNLSIYDLHTTVDDMIDGAE